MLETKVAHQRAHHAIEPALGLARRGDHIEQFVTIVDLSTMVDHDQTIGIAIECDPQIRPLGEYRLAQMLWPRGADLVIDVESVWLHPDGQHLGAQLVKHARCDLVGRAMGAVQGNAHAAQVQLIRKSALAEFDIAAGRIADAPHLAQSG